MQQHQHSESAVGQGKYPVARGDENVIAKVHVWSAAR